MSFKIGSRAIHKLTNDEVIILANHDQNKYLVRLPNYGEILVWDFELTTLVTGDK